MAQPVENTSCLQGPLEHCFRMSVSRVTDIMFGIAREDKDGGRVCGCLLGSITAGI